MSRRARRASFVVALLLAGTAITGLVRSGGPEPGTGISPPGSGPLVRAEESGPVSVFDRGVGAVVEVDPAVVAAEQARAARAPGYRDADGSPRYMLVWEHGRLVPGPALECTASDGPGPPRSCTVVG